jgi:DNA modification methylase
MNEIEMKNDLIVSYNELKESISQVNQLADNDIKESIINRLESALFFIGKYVSDDMEIVIFYNNQPTYNPQKTKRDKPITSGKRCHPRNRTGTEENVTYEAEKKTYDDKHPTTIISIPRQIGKGTSHPTEKPIELMEYLIKTYTNEGNIVLDNTMGSGTTNLACIKLNRKSIGIEKEKQYYDVAVRRASEYCH